MFQRSCREIFPYVVGLIFINQKEKISCCGTGTIVNPRGLILTANHVLKGSGWGMMANRNFIGRVPGTFGGSYQLVAKFPEHDLALIHIPNLPLDGLKKPMDWLFTDLRYGQPVGSFGYPAPKVDVDFILQKDGSVAELHSIEMALRFKSYFIAGPYLAPPSKTYTLDSFAYGGHSGGPVFDREGRLFGVMVQTELSREKGYEISYCTAVALSNIQSELVQAQIQRP